MLPGLMVVLSLLCGLPTPGAPSWRTLQSGVEYAAIDQGLIPDLGKELLHVVRVDPNKATLRMALASETKGSPQPAHAWVQQQGLLVAINAGMYQTDHRSNVGHLQHGDHVNNAGWSTQYQAALGFDPREKGLPPAIFVDLDEPGARERLAPYRSVVQNLRLIKGDGKNVWKPSARRWSEALVAADKEGRILFIFCRAAFDMHALNERLLALPLGITRAMHVEGGPEASLSILAPGLKLDLAGSFETGFNENDGNNAQWAIPNMLGVVRSLPVKER
jgi:hypothetical protein